MKLLKICKSQPCSSIHISTIPKAMLPETIVNTTISNFLLLNIEPLYIPISMNIYSTCLSGEKRSTANNTTYSGSIEDTFAITGSSYIN